LTDQERGPSDGRKPPVRRRIRERQANPGFASTPPKQRCEEIPMTAEELLIIHSDTLGTPTDLSADAVRDISGALNALLADMFALYIKTKNFHWHVSGSHFRDFHLLLDEQADQIFATTDPIAERVRKIGGTTLRSIGQIAAQKRLLDNDAEFVTPLDMLAELRGDNKQLTAEMRRTHALCDDHKDVATASLLEVWIDESERRTWFLFEATRRAEP
jgi:starvation-inducible DNA-binding protein